MKHIAVIIALFLLGTLASCGSKDFNNQPWIPKKVTGKSKHGHGNKKAQYTRNHNTLF